MRNVRSRLRLCNKLWKAAHRIVRGGLSVGSENKALNDKQRGAND